MKRLPYILLLSVLIVVLITCRKRPELKIYKLELAEETVVTSTNGATISASYSYPGYIPTIALFVSTNSVMGDAVEYTSTATENTITATATDLAPNTKYYYYFCYSNGINLINTDTKNFITEGFTLPEVTTGEISEIASNSAHCSGEATSAGNSKLSAIGFCYGTRQNPNLQDNVINCGDSLGVFEVDITNLDINTLYYVRTFATNEGGTAYGEQKTFTTLGQVPTVVTIPITFVTSSSAVSGGSISNNGGNAVIEKGVCWSTSQNPTISGNHTTDGNGTGEFTSNLTGLEENTTYYIRAYATNSEGTSYGSQKTFITSQNVVVPTVTTSEVTNISTTSASCGGNVTSAGNGTISARGVCWSTSQNPTTSNSHSIDGTGTGAFTSSITGLTENTTYYVRAYATNEAGTNYGEQKTFTTPHATTLPTVTTNNITEITQETAVSGGNVTSAGYGTVSAKGVCWSTSQNPTITDSHTTDGTGTGSFISNISGLSSNTTYYVRAYATNESGTNYGEQKLFTTEIDAPTPPTWTNGILPGLFSINSTEQVHFSQGNLQYKASTNTWRFAENQWNFIGGSMGFVGGYYYGNVYENSILCNNSELSSSYDGWIDLFGWGTSGYNHNGHCYQPWSHTTSSSDYYAYYGDYYNLYDQTAMADWGYNAISNGGNQENQWRTMKNEEWDYVINNIERQHQI